jgi:hypothetical protein
MMSDRGPNRENLAGGGQSDYNLSVSAASKGQYA